MTYLTYFQFSCNICHQTIREIDKGIRIENKEIEENLLFGKIITVHVGHKSEASVHWNIITLDQNGEYRGHKHAFVEKLNENIEYYNFLTLEKYSKKFINKLISDVISGQRIALDDTDDVLSSIIENALRLFVIPNNNEAVFANQISTGNFGDDANLMCIFEIDKGKYQRLKSLPTYKWVEILLKRLSSLDDKVIHHLINSYMESIRKGYYELMDRLKPYFSISEACPISDPGSTIQVQLFMNNIIPKKELENFKGYCTKEEYEIIIALISRQFFLQYMVDQ